MTFDHFQGKAAVDHLKDARARGADASAEFHGVEIPGHIAAATDAAKDTATMLFLLWLVLQLFGMAAPWTFYLMFSIGIAIWKTGRSALLAYARLERLHRLIEEERWEIEHHRHQERDELMALYRLKGFSENFSMKSSMCLWPMTIASFA